MSSTVPSPQRPRPIYPTAEVLVVRSLSGCQIKARQLHDQGFSLSNFWEKSVTFPWAHEEYVVFFPVVVRPLESAHLPITDLRQGPQYRRPRPVLQFTNSPASG